MKELIYFMYIGTKYTCISVGICGVLKRTVSVVAIRSDLRIVYKLMPIFTFLAANPSQHT